VRTTDVCVQVYVPLRLGRVDSVMSLRVHLLLFV